MDDKKNQHKPVKSVDSFKNLIGLENDVCWEKEDFKSAESSDSDPWIDSSSFSDDSDIVESEWFANDGPIDAKPKYDFEVKPITQPKFDFEVKPITSVGPKCDLEAKSFELVGPKNDFEAKLIKSLEPKCDFTRQNEENKPEQMKYDLYAVIVHAGSTSSLGHYYCFIYAKPNEWYKFDDTTISWVHKDVVLAEEAYIMFYAMRDTLWFSDFIALEAINSSYFIELKKIVDNELKKTVQTSYTPGPPSAIYSSLENNASQDIGVTERIAPSLPKSPSRSQSTLDQVASENQWQMDPEQETEIMMVCSMIKRRVPGPRGEELMTALCRLGSHGSSLSRKDDGSSVDRRSSSSGSAALALDRRI
ncbi:hypothetical protein FXO38_32167 [Capsicum annuum]|nr:hypothetical protein FXO38_32167 [Capsicum annuum]